MTRRKGASIGADLDAVILVARGSSAVSDDVLAFRGGETGCDDAGVIVVRDVVGAKEVKAWDENGLTVRIVLLAFAADVLDGPVAEVA